MFSENCGKAYHAGVMSGSESYGKWYEKSLRAKVRERQ